MKIVWKSGVVKRAGAGPMCDSYESRVIPQLQRSSLRSGGVSTPPGIPSLEHQGPHNIWLLKSVEILSSKERQESARKPGALLKG